MKLIYPQFFKKTVLRLAIVIAFFTSIVTILLKATLLDGFIFGSVHFALSLFILKFVMKYLLVHDAQKSYSYKGIKMLRLGLLFTLAVVILISWYFTIAEKSFGHWLSLPVIILSLNILDNDKYFLLYGVVYKSFIINYDAIEEVSLIEKARQVQILIDSKSVILNNYTIQEAENVHKEIGRRRNLKL